MKKALFILMIVVVAINLACANIGSPDGGPYDEEPPKLLRTSPKFGSVNSKTTKVVLEFDENVKLENANEKVIISPPQIEPAEIEAIGKKIVVELQDSLKAGATYTIDFADAIEDNNEGNPMGDYAFTFSTGTTIDTMQVSGYVLDASNLEPLKGVVVGLYALGDDSLGVNFPDSIVKTKEFERISRTDSKGHFVIKGVSNGYYKVFAVKDQDQTYTYSQKSEQMAYTDRILHPWSKPDVRTDTIWHDSIHYDSIQYIKYTHFYPDDIILTAFASVYRDKQLLKTERSLPECLTLYFTAPYDTLPILRGLNYDANDLFVIDSNVDKDTIRYWIKDTMMVNQDSLMTELKYFATDTTGGFVEKTDTINFVPKYSKEKRDKQAKIAYEDYVKDWKKENKKELKENPDLPIPPMPEKYLDIKSKKAQLAPDQNFTFEFEEPIETIVDSLISFTQKVDSIIQPVEFILQQDSGNIKSYTLYAEWQPGEEYELKIDTAAFVSIYGKRVAGKTIKISVNKLDTYGTLFIKLLQADSCAVVELLGSNDQPIKQVHAIDNKADFYFINPGTYFLRLFYDYNGNGIWDSGDYDEKLAPEPVYYYPKEIPIKANWEINQDWYPEAVELFKQKPAKITKQKADKQKTSTRNRNKERLEKKKNEKKRSNNN